MPHRVAPRGRDRPAREFVGDLAGERFRQSAFAVDPDQFLPLGVRIGHELAAFAFEVRSLRVNVEAEAGEVSCCSPGVDAVRSWTNRFEGRRVLAVNTFFGIPAHPLLVHIPAVLLPLAAVGVIVMAIRPAWHRRYRWAVLAVGFVGALGAILAADAGESLEQRIVAKEGAAAARGWHEHAEAGETARLFGIIFVVVLAMFVLVPWYLERRTAQRRPVKLPGVVSHALLVLALAAAAGTVITVIQAGHSGAKSVWCETMTPPNCDD